MRNNCGRLCLHIEGPKGVKRVFLFGQRTVQMGRAQENSLKGLGNGMEDCPHRPRANDMILRVVEANKDGSTGEHVERSLLISRVHGALMAARDGPREHMKIIDVGFNRKGSNNGTWVGNSQIRPWEWRELSDTEQVMIGRDNTRGLSGLGLTLRVLRGDRAAGNRIEAVAITRDDALKDTNQYVIVVREATIGFGQNMSICLGPYSAKVWARIRIDEAGQWAMRAEKDGPLGGMAGSDDTGYRTGLDGLSMKGGELSL
ncbi:MAG: hypothetical protein NTY46_16740 [Candidatus Sumerlaeota bacterium]|nr:hypothetical protein [Candidatus Sumerlaeota bacterium]